MPIYSVTSKLTPLEPSNKTEATRGEGALKQHRGPVAELGKEPAGNVATVHRCLHKVGASDGKEL